MQPRGEQTAILEYDETGRTLIDDRGRGSSLGRSDPRVLYRPNSPLPGAAEVTSLAGKAWRATKIDGDESSRNW